MLSPRGSAGRSWPIWVGALVVLAGAVRLPDLGAPLLEGAAGKQTHTAMVARNLYRGSSTLARPIVDDIGRPGYFVKEFPLVPATIAALYGVAGRVDERLARSIGLFAWLAATPLLTRLLRPALGQRGALLAGLWFVISPMGIVYSRAVMSDAPAVAASLCTLATLFWWRKRPMPRRALAAGALASVAFLLKPHVLFWLVPAGLTVAFARGRDGLRVRFGAAVALGAIAALPLALGALWYLHAAAVHRLYPVPGAMVAEGWVDASLLLRVDLYREIARQVLFVVFTPAGAVAALLGALRGPRFAIEERALLAWGAGVLLQSLVFATRMFDEHARGTEYYQLPLVPVAALLIGRGIDVLWSTLAVRSRRLAAGIVVGTLLLLVAGALLETHAATRVPERYATLVDDCRAVRALTRADEEFVVLADRGGTVLYYCDRRGQTFVLSDSVGPSSASKGSVASPIEIGTVLRNAGYLYLPFPELLRSPTLIEFIETHWREVPLAGRKARLYERRPEETRWSR